MQIRLCAADDIVEGEMLQVRVDGYEPFAVYHVAGNFFVTEDTCTHGKASLADEGELEDHVVTCTWHDGQFDIRTGEPCAMPCTKPIRTYPVTIVDGAVCIDVE